MKRILLLLTLTFIFSSCTLTNLVAKGTINKKIIILDQRSLIYDNKNGISFSELSDITYDKKNQKLYMVGDKGYLYTFSANFDKKIEKLSYQSVYKIKEKHGKTGHIDSEGLTHNPQGELIVSFERKARISQLHKKGKIESDYKMLKKLKKRKIYKNINSIFEGVAYHPKHGILMAVEFPIHQQKNTQQTIYSLQGKEWHFKAEKHTNSAVTALEVMDDGNVLVLERAYSGLSNPFIITLKKVYLDDCHHKEGCRTKVLASFNSFEGWGINNFEGLAKVGKNRYIMISDNHNQAILPTILIYFEVKE